MLPQATIQSYISKAIAILSNAASFEAACKTTPVFADTLSNSLEQQNQEYTIEKHAGKPFDEIRINLIEEKWRKDLWWGQAYLSVKISKLAPVFTSEKVMIQLDYSVSDTEVNSWQHLAGKKEAAIENLVNANASNSGFSKLSGELSQWVDTGALALNAHYRKWKPTVYAVFFEKII